MKAKRFVSTLVLLFCLPVLADQTQYCETVEDNTASSELRTHEATRRELGLLEPEKSFDVKHSAEALADEEPDRVVGQLRKTATEGDAKSKRRAYMLLRAMRFGGRADVADQFLQGLDEADAVVRQVSARGLGDAPSGKREKAGDALIDRMQKEEDQLVAEWILASLMQVCSPKHKNRRGDLLSLLGQELPTDMDPRLFAAWKRHEAHVAIKVLGPEGAIQLFRELSTSKTGEGYGAEGAAAALAGYGRRHFPKLPAEETDGLRDLFREYAVSLLSQDSREKAERDRHIRRQAVQLLFAVVASRREGRRDADIEAIHASLTYALGFERDGSELVKTFNVLLDWIREPEALQTIGG